VVGFSRAVVAVVFGFEFHRGAVEEGVGDFGVLGAVGQADVVEVFVEDALGGLR
jgi:hypothetical protein